jgi:S-adenosylmethionine hydrolase
MSEFKTDSSVITLTTDFGTSDWFVGVMKGVMASINPETQFIDITHHISHGNIREAAFVLKQALPWFPEKSIHLAVVDPGVGTSRKGLIIETESHFLVGPDNGIFSWALLDSEMVRIIQLDAMKFGNCVSHTFHGRDLFAPAAARLSLGENPMDLGEQTDSMIQIEWPQHTATKTGFSGQILHKDRFGNLITNLPNTSVSPDMLTKPFKVLCLDKDFPIEIHPTYDLASSSKPTLITASTGFLEFAIKDGSAAYQLGWSAGQTFELIR